MANLLDSLTRIVASKLRVLGFASPRAEVISALLNQAYLASLRTEEGRFVRGSLTFADPRKPDMDPPITRRADYPGFTAFSRPMPLTPELLAKLCRAVDQWSGSIAVYGKTASDLVAWGVVDQIVHTNVRRNRESIKGSATNPGLLTVIVDAAGALSVYHGDLFLAGLRQDQLITRESPVLRSDILTPHIASALTPVAVRIASALGAEFEPRCVLAALCYEWSRTLERLCIGLRRLGTGGAFLISPRPFDRFLDITYRFPYQRLGSALILGVLDDFHRERTKQQVFEEQSDPIPAKSLRDFWYAEADSQDRDFELTGAVRLVTSLASMDGVVLLAPSLQVLGFGVKIKSTPSVGRVYDGGDLAQRGARAKTIDQSRFGTRHSSILRYCRAASRAFGVVVSQDGQVRLVMTLRRKLMLWNNVQLLDYEHDVRRYALESRRGGAYRSRHRKEAGLGYSPMPKTLEQLSQVKRYGR